MQFQEIRGVNKPVPRLFYGTSIGPFLRGEDCCALLDELYALGVTAFDTARVYGKAEQSLGAWLASRGLREKVILLSKGGHPNVLGMRRLDEKSVRRDFATSCRLLHTDYIDIYLLHRDDPRRPAGEMVELLNALHAEGKIGAFGGSNWAHTRLEEANEYAYSHNLIPFAMSSPYYGLGDMVKDPWGNGAVSVAGPSHVQAREWYQRTKMPLLAYSVLGHGLFSGKVHERRDFAEGWARRAFGSAENFERVRRIEQLAAEKHCSVAQLALAWVLNAELNTFAVVSASSASRMRENLAAAEMTLTAEERAWLDLC